MTRLSISSSQLVASPFQTTQEGHVAETEVCGTVSEGYLTFDLPPFSSVVLSSAMPESK